MHKRVYLQDGSGNVVNCVLVPADWTSEDRRWQPQPGHTVCSHPDAKIGDQVIDGALVTRAEMERKEAIRKRVRAKAEARVAAEMAATETDPDVKAVLQEIAKLAKPQMPGRTTA